MPTPLHPALKILAGLLAVGMIIPPAAANDEPWLRCRALVDPAARLACYDAVRPQATAPAATPPAAGLGSPASPGRAAPTTGVLPPEQRNFGLERQQAQAVDNLRSRLPGSFEGWGPKTRFQLANGQAWQVVDGSSAFYQLRDPVVTIRRAAMGSFLMEIEGVNQVIRVRRVD